jgi:putrescine transport system permease protein
MRAGAFSMTVLALGLAFLYLPILLLVIYSFNASRLVTVWGGFSTQWYGAALSNGPLLSAAWISLEAAFASALFATLMGTWLAVVLTRLGPFRGREALAFLGFVPLVLPEIILGLSLLLLFVALGVDRGFWTVTLSHAVLTTCFVAVVVQARLAGFDRNLEEAAIDLGASPTVAFLRVTLPNIAPSIVAGFLLAFTLSLDDLVIASFTSGPGATTLPLRIYSQVRLGVTPEINAISSLMIGFVAVVVVAVSLLTKARLSRG